MKGVVFQAARHAVTDLLGPEAWDDLAGRAGTNPRHHAGSSYPDGELAALVQAAAELLGWTVDEVLVAIGRAALPHLVNVAPDLTAGCHDPFQLLRVVDDVIHVEVLQLYPDARPPKFDYEDLPDGGLRITYESSRGLDSLAEGLMLGVGDHYDTPLTVSRVGTDNGRTAPAGPGTPVVFDVVPASHPAPAPAN